MKLANPNEEQRHERKDYFASTHWSVVLVAGHENSNDGQTALAKLCETYWYPIYAFARRFGHNRDDAEDLTQGFFAHFLEHKLAGRASPEKGKFRSFLLVSFKHFMADERDWASYQKRGGGNEIISLEAHTAEDRYGLEPVDLLDPEKQYEVS